MAIPKLARTGISKRFKCKQTKPKVGGKRLAEIGYCYCYECRMKHREQDKRYREKIKAKREQNESKTRAKREQNDRCLSCPLPDCIDGDLTKCEARIARYKRNKAHYRG